MTDKQLFQIGGRILVDAATRLPIVLNAPSPATGTNTGTNTGSIGGGTTPAPTPTPVPGVVTGVAITSVSGATAGYAWNAYTAAAVTEYSAELRPRGGAAGTSDTWAGIGRWAGPPGSKGGLDRSRPDCGQGDCGLGCLDPRFTPRLFPVRAIAV